MDKQKILEILNQELALATGCTEPAAIAFTAAEAGRRLNEPIRGLRVTASGNMIKNAMAAGIPGTRFTGVAYAAAAGAVGGDPTSGLRVLDSVSPGAFREAEALVQNGGIAVDTADSPEKLYIDVTAYGDRHSARAVVSGTHTNLVRIEVDGRAVLEKKPGNTAPEGVSSEEIRRALNVETIYRFCMEMDPSADTPDLIRQSIAVNSAIAEEGLRNDYGLKIGKTLRQHCEKGILGNDIVTEAMILAAAGADARMAGAPLPVVSNSGSGNQGIAATMPVAAVAKRLNTQEADLIRAVTLSNLIAIYIKSKFGRLSGLCGATVAATGASCGVTLLMGGGLKEIGYAIQSMIGNVTGMLCDGAKADCALKISTCVNAAMQAALMAVNGIGVQSTDGIVEDDVEKTIDNFSLLGNEGSQQADRLVLRMMLEKDRP